MALRYMIAKEKDEGTSNIRTAVIIAENPFDVMDQILRTSSSLSEVDSLCMDFEDVDFTPDTPGEVKFYTIALTKT